MKKKVLIKLPITNSVFKMKHLSDASIGNRAIVKTVQLDSSSSILIEKVIQFPMHIKYFYSKRSFYEMKS